MKTTKSYKIAVFTDLSETAKSTIKSAINLAKLIDGKVHVFHTRSSKDIMSYENQMSSLRAMDEAYGKAKQQLKTIIKDISISENTPIGYSLSFGNVKKEMKNYLDAQEPDIVVLGKKRKKLMDFLGDGITPFIFKQHKGMIFITGNAQYQNMEQQLALGILNSSKEILNTALAKTLFQKSQSPLKSFNIVNDTYKTPDKKDHTTIEYVFENNSNTVRRVSNYIHKNNISLLCVKKANAFKKGLKKVITPDFHVMMNRLNVPILVLGN